MIGKKVYFRASHDCPITADERIGEIIDRIEFKEPAIDGITMIVGTKYIIQESQTKEIFIIYPQSLMRAYP